MGSLEKKIQEYKEYVDKVKRSNLYLDYMELLGRGDEDSILKARKLEQSVIMRKFLKVNKYLKIINNPFDRTFFERYVKFIKMNFDKKSLKNSQECFEDGIPMRLWFESLVYNYHLGNLTTYYSEKIEHLQKLVYEKNLTGDICYCVTKLQITLELSDGKMADFLGVSNSLVKMLKKDASNISLTLWKSLFSSIEEKLNGNLNADVFLVVNELFFLVKQKINELSLQEQQKSKVDLKSIKDKLDSYREVFLEGDIKKAFNCYINGCRFYAWWKEYWSVNVKELEPSEEINEIVKKYNGLVEVLFDAKLMYSELNNEDNFGYVLRKFLLSIGFDKKELAECTGIPILFITKILNNDLRPDLDMLDKILLFLNGWKCENEYQEKFLLETRECFLKLYENVEIKYNVYDLDHLSEYESYMKLDQDLKKFIKENDFDWYVKCVTYNYILNTVGISPNLHYFYDGGSVDKWFLLQKFILNKKGEESFLLKNKRIMFNYLRDNKAEWINDSSKLKDAKAKEDELFNHFSVYVNSFIDYLYKNRKLPVEEVVENFLLIDVWNICNRVCRNNNSLNDFQIKHIKQMKYYYVYSSKSGKKDNGLINFAFYFSLFMENLNLSVNKVSDITGIPITKLSRYSDGFSFPTNSELNKFLVMIENLKLQYCDNNYCLSCIEDFKKVIIYIVDFDCYMKPICNNKINVENRMQFNIEMDNDILKVVKLRFPEWYEFFVRLVNNLDKSLLINAAFVDNVGNSFSWFMDMIELAHNDQLSEEQNILLNYLIKINKRNVAYISYVKFNSLFNFIEKYIYENEEKPVCGYVSQNGRDIREYFDEVEQFYYGKNNNFWFLSDRDIVRIKRILQFLAIKNNSLVEKNDDILDQELFVGQHLNRLKIALRLPTTEFANKLCMDLSKLIAILQNTCCLSDEEVENIIVYLSKLDKQSLSMDQVNEIDDFVLFVKSLNVSRCNKLILGK